MQVEKAVQAELEQARRDAEGVEAVMEECLASIDKLLPSLQQPSPQQPAAKVFILRWAHAIPASK